MPRCQDLLDEYMNEGDRYSQVHEVLSHLATEVATALWATSTCQHQVLPCHLPAKGLISPCQPVPSPA